MIKGFEKYDLKPEKLVKNYDDIKISNYKKHMHTLKRYQQNVIDLITLPIYLPLMFIGHIGECIESCVYDLVDNDYEKIIEFINNFNLSKNMAIANNQTEFDVVYPYHPKQKFIDIIDKNLYVIIKDIHEKNNNIYKFTIRFQ